MSRKVIPMGTSINPLPAIFPAKAKTFVPEDFSIPIALKASPPFFIIQGIFAQVSTLLIFVGLPQRPDSAG